MTATRSTKPRKCRKTLSPKQSMPSIVPVADIPIVPCGSAIVMSDMNAEMVERCKAIQKSTPGSCCCWNDCHEFDWEPCRIPIAYNKDLDMCFSRGIFCSFSCAKTYCMRNRLSGSGNISFIALEANRSRRRNLGVRRGLSDVIYVKSVPPRERLKMFGGSMSIDEYRKGALRYDGSIIGGEDQDILDDLVRTRATREDLVPPAFLDENAVQTLRCLCAPGSGVAKPLRDDVMTTFGLSNRRSSNKCRVRNLCTDESIRQRMQQTANVKPSNEGTLFSSMGIVVSSATSE